MKKKPDEGGHKIQTHSNASCIVQLNFLKVLTGQVMSFIIVKLQHMALHLETI